MKTKFRITLAWALMTVIGASAQISSSLHSTTVNADGTVTFRYDNKDAREVSVDVQFAGLHKMKRDDAGLWTVTLGPAAPDMYPYCFHVDGVSVQDPLCEEYFPNEGFKNSLLEIRDPHQTLLHDICPVPHGAMEYIQYYSNSLGHTNRALVYLPPSYDADSHKQYPVFYLISGTTDTEEVYYKVGRVNYILDNLIAEGKAQEMIVVLPYGNPNKLLPELPKDGMPVTGFGADVFSRDLVNDLMPYVESHYRILADRDHRAIGGFSRGGNQGLSNGLHHLDKFSYLCSYSSFTSTDIPEVYDHAADTNSKLHLFWLGVGTDDFLYGNARDYTEFLDQKGIRCVKEYTHDKFGHTWMNAKYFLSRTLPLLFNEKASAQAMTEAKPTLPKTGKEKQFTPGVMARLFPKPIVSPEYVGNDVFLRFKADHATNVVAEVDYLQQSDKEIYRANKVVMTKDSDGVWSTCLSNASRIPFRYCFHVDGLQVADPSNMYLSPDRGFKYSISYAQLPDDKNLRHGVVRYNYGDSTAVYRPSADVKQDELRVIALLYGPDDTMESWFKTGGAAELADRLLASGQIKPCLLKVYAHESDIPAGIPVVRSSDEKTWAHRMKKLEQLLRK